LASQDTRSQAQDHQSGSIDSVRNTPRVVQVLLDVAAIGLAVATFAQVADPDILLHVVWVTLALGAFLFGLRVALVRIFLASAFVLVYAILADQGVIGNQLEFVGGLSEWPLMVVISLIVALMADRTMSASRRYAALYRQASDRLTTVQDDERKRLAHDLHEGIGPTLNALMYTLDGAEAALWAGRSEPPPLALATISRAQELAAIALGETGQVTSRLRPRRLREAGLGVALRELATTAGMKVEVRIDPRVGRPGLLAPQRETDVYRFVQEALANAARHSAASRAWVVLEPTAACLFVQVGDDGGGFVPGTVLDRGLGLAGMRERAAALGTEVNIRSGADHGTIIELRIPWESPVSGLESDVAPTVAIG
jgi:signal transduction histidine kinase